MKSASFPSRLLVLPFALLVGCASEQSAPSESPAKEDTANTPEQASDHSSATGGESNDDSSTSAAPKPASARWCSQQKAAACADFDGEARDKGWFVEGDPKAIGKTASNRSSPHALLVTRSAAGGNVGLATLVARPSPKGIHVSFDLKVAASAVTGESFYDQLMTIQIPDQAKTRAAEGISLELRTDPDGMVKTNLQAFSLIEPTTMPPKYVVTADVTTLPLDRWVAIAIDVDLGSPTELDAILTYDGVQAGTITVARAPASLADVKLKIGSLMPSYPSTVGPAPFKAAFDNVLLDVQ